MPRVISNAVLAALTSTYLRPAIFVQAQFASSTVYLWTGYGSITWNGQTWSGVGQLGNVSTVEESSNVEAKGITLSLVGFDATLLPLVVNEFGLGMPVTVWLALLDPMTGTLIPDPFISFAGRMDQPTISVGGDAATIAINCENRLVDMNTPVDRRYTDQDQKMDHPTDRGFEWVNPIQDVTIVWGRHPATNINFTIQGHPD